MSIQRQSMTLMTGLYGVYPDLEKRLSSRSAMSLISAMAIAGMFTQTKESEYNCRDFDERKQHALASIYYELSLRAIAKSIGIDEYVACGFIRGCFAANNLSGLYPNVANMFGTEYSHVVSLLGDHLTQYVIEYLAGVEYRPERVDKNPERRASRNSSQYKREKYGTFYLLPVFAKIKKMRNDLPVKLYFLEVIAFIQSHPDRLIPRPNHLTSKKIFIDEIIDYAREYDAARFEQFHDEISDLLLAFDECSTLPDCQSLKSKLGLFNLGMEIKTIKNGFTDFMKSTVEEPESKKSPKPDSESESDDVDAKVDADAEAGVNDVADDAPQRLELEAARALSAALAPAGSPAGSPVAPRINVRRANVDQQFEQDTARAIELSLLTH